MGASSIVDAFVALLTSSARSHTNGFIKIRSRAALAVKKASGKRIGDIP